MAPLTPRQSPRTPQRRFNDTTSATNRRSSRTHPHTSSSSTSTAPPPPPPPPPATTRPFPASPSLRAPSRSRPSSRSVVSVLASPRLTTSRSKRTAGATATMMPHDTTTLFRPSTATPRLQQMSQGASSSAAIPPRRRRLSSSSSFECSLAAEFDARLQYRDLTPAGAAATPEERQLWANHLFQKLCLRDRPMDTGRSRRQQQELHRKRERSSSLGRVKKGPSATTSAAATDYGTRATTHSRNVLDGDSAPSAPSSPPQRRQRRPSLPASVLGTSRPAWSYETAPMPLGPLDASLNAPNDAGGSAHLRPSRPTTMIGREYTVPASPAIAQTAVTRGGPPSSPTTKRTHARALSKSANVIKVSSQEAASATATGPPPSPRQPARTQPPPLPLSRQLGLQMAPEARTGDATKSANIEPGDAVDPPSTKRFSFGNLRKRTFTEGAAGVAPLKPLARDVGREGLLRSPSSPPLRSPLPRRQSRGPQPAQTEPQSPGSTLPFLFKAYESGSRGEAGDAASGYKDKMTPGRPRAQTDARSTKRPNSRSSRGTSSSQSSLTSLFVSVKERLEQQDDSHSHSRSASRQHSRSFSTTLPDAAADGSTEALLVHSQRPKSASRPAEQVPGSESEILARDDPSNGRRSRESSASRWLFRRSRQGSVSTDGGAPARPSSACSRRTKRSSSPSEAHSPVLSHSRSSSRPSSRAAAPGADLGRVLSSSPTMLKANIDADPFAKGNIRVRSPEPGQYITSPTIRSSAGPTPGSPSLVRRKRSFPDVQPQAQFMRPGYYRHETRAQLQFKELGKSLLGNQKGSMSPMEAQSESANVQGDSSSPYGQATPAKSDASLGVPGRIVLGLGDPSKGEKHTSSSSSSNGSSAGSGGRNTSNNSSSDSAFSSAATSTSTSATSASSGLSATLSRFRIPTGGALRRFKLGAGAASSTADETASTAQSEHKRPSDLKGPETGGTARTGAPASEDIVAAAPRRVLHRSSASTSTSGHRVYTAAPDAAPALAPAFTLAAVKPAPVPARAPPSPSREWEREREGEVRPRSRIGHGHRRTRETSLSQAMAMGLPVQRA